MEQLQLDVPPNPFRSGALALRGPAASGAPNQQQAAQQWGGDGMDIDDARSEFSHPESHPDSEGSASSFESNRGASLRATPIGSSRPCQQTERRRPQDRPNSGDEEEMRDRLLKLIVHEEQQNESAGDALESLSWTKIADKFNAHYIRQELRKNSKWCRDRCDPLYLSCPPPPPAPRPRALSLNLLPLVCSLRPTQTLHSTIAHRCPFASCLLLPLTPRPSVRTAPQVAQLPGS